MVENGRISLLQFGIMIFMFTIGSAVLLLPSIEASVSKQDAWIAVLLSIIIQAAFVWLWTRLAGIYPNKSLIQYCELIVGKWLGKIIGIFYISFFLYLSALVLRNLGDFITTNILIETPLEFIHIIFMLPVVYGVYLGLEVIARASEILFPWIVLLFTITILLLIKVIDLSKLLPILSEDWHHPIKGLYPLLGFPISEVVVFLTIMPFIAHPNYIKKYFYVSLILTAIFASFVIAVTISVLGVDLTARSNFSVFDLAKEIKIGNFLNRVEILVGGIWIMTIFVKLCVCFYAANLATAHLFNLKSYRITILPYAILVIALSIIVYKNPAHAFWFIMGAYPIYSLFHGLVIPLILLLVAKIRKPI
jgi:spore germination protein KB